MATISVLTIAKGRRAHLDRLIEGLARSAQPPGELVVVNMDGAALSLTRQGFAVRVVDFPAGMALPLAAARNRAAATAQGRLLLFLDVDCIVSARTLGAVQAVFDAQDCMLCPEVRYLPAGAAGPGWREAALLAAGRLHPGRRFPAQGLRHEPNAGFLWSVAFAVRARSFDRLGGFDEQFTGYGAEDTDLGFNGAAHRLKLMLAGGAPVFHQHHPIHDPPLQHFAAIVRNASLFYGKWGVWPMQEALSGFVAAGLLTRERTRLTVLRYPTEAEIAASRQTDARLF